MQQLRNMSPAEILGISALVLAAFAIWALNVGLSYAFFVSIAPPDQPWFPYYGLCLTEIGAVLWMLVFLFMKGPFTRVMGLLMACASGIASLTLAGTQFMILIQRHYHAITDPGVYQNISNALLGLVIANFIVLFVKLIVWGFSRPGMGFFDRPNNGNLIPGYPQGMVSLEEYLAMQNALTGQIASIQEQREIGGTADPLAHRQLPSPRRSPEDTAPQRTIKPLPAMGQPKEEMTLGQLAQDASGAVSSAMKKVSGSMRRGRKAKVLAPGLTNETTNASGLESDLPCEAIAESDKNGGDPVTD